MTSVILRQGTPHVCVILVGLRQACLAGCPARKERHRPMERNELIEALKADLRDEHSAIVQYLYHAYLMGEGEMAAEIEEIAREEMRHFKWLSDVLTSFGEEPDLERDPVYANVPSLAYMMRVDAWAEERAIERYERRLGMSDQPKWLRTYEAILSDERHHREKFRQLTAELGADPDAPLPEDFQSWVGGPTMEGREPLSAEAAEAVRMLNLDVSIEYNNLLRYIHQSFVTEDCPFGKDLLVDRSQEEMKHLGWLAEKVVELGGVPEIEHPPVHTTRDLEEMLKVNIEAERGAQERYAAHAEAIADPSAKRLLNRIREQEVMHEGEFVEKLEEVEAKKKPGLTVGRLIGKKQGEE